MLYFQIITEKGDLWSQSLGSANALELPRAIQGWAMPAGLQSPRSFKA